MRYQIGFINLKGAPLFECTPSEIVVVKNMHYYIFLRWMLPAVFRDPAAGWVVRGLAAPFIRILEVSDPTPEEAAAEEAEAAAIHRAV